MKKIIALLLVAVMAISLAACVESDPTGNTTTNPNTDTNPSSSATNPSTPDDVTVMTHAEYIAAEDGTPVVVEFYVQATQAWYQDQITIYGQTPEGGYFGYEVACSEADAAKLVPGTKVRLTGEKGSWSGEIEVMNATMEILEGDTWIAEPVELTGMLTSENLINYQNMLASFVGMTVESVSYKNGVPGDGNDIYVTLSRNGNSYDFCVEAYLTGPESDVYKAFETLQVGDVVDVEGFVYWYEGINTHITAITPSQGVLTHEQYIAAEEGTVVTVEFYVQATQAWYQDKITIYGQDANGGYFGYEVACSEADAAKLVPGTLIRVTGDKGSWSGEVEIMNGEFEILLADAWMAEAADLTALLGTDELLAHQNELAAFKGMTIESVSYKNGEPGEGNDIYVTLSYNGSSYEFCVEAYLTGPESDVYKAFETLKAGDVVNVEGFVYWYENVNTHITAISVAA